MKSPRKRDEGPWVWFAYPEERYLFLSQMAAPCFLTFVRRVHSQLSLKPLNLKEASAPRTSSMASEGVIGNRMDRVMHMSARDAGAC